MKFPFPFYLSRFVGLNPSQQSGADSRGIEFVHFQDRVILKVTGNYNAAYDSARLTKNERAARTFRGVVLPILEQLTSALPPELACDGIGFEISHHTHTYESTYDYEGKEILVVVLNRDDAWTLPRATTDSERQDIVIAQRFLSAEPHSAFRFLNATPSTFLPQQRCRRPGRARLPRRLPSPEPRFHHPN